MVRVITNKKQIANLQNKFQKQLDRLLNEKIICWIGYLGGSFQDTASYSGKSTDVDPSSPRSFKADLSWRVGVKQNGISNQCAIGK